MKPVGSVPSREWLAEAVEALSTFSMAHDFAEGTWEHEFYMEMVDARRVRVGVRCEEYRFVEFLVSHVDSMQLNDIEKRVSTAESGDV